MFHSWIFSFEIFHLKATQHHLSLKIKNLKRDEDRKITPIWSKKIFDQSRVARVYSENLANKICRISLHHVKYHCKFKTSSFSTYRQDTKHLITMTINAKIQLIFRKCPKNPTSILKSVFCKQTTTTIMQRLQHRPKDKHRP